MKIAGVLTCWDRVIITWTLPEICHGEALAGYLSRRGICLFDYPRWAEPLRDVLRAHAEQVAAEAGLEIEFTLAVQKSDPSSTQPASRSPSR
jgi:hypothetical protein